MARQKTNPYKNSQTRRSLAQKTVPQVEDPVMQKLHHEQAERMLLASFMSG